MKMYRKGDVCISLNEVHADAFKRYGWEEVSQAAVVETPSETVVNEPVIAGGISDSELNEMTKEELLTYAKKIGLDASERANKAQLIDSIRNTRK